MEDIHVNMGFVEEGITSCEGRIPAEEILIDFHRPYGGAVENISGYDFVDNAEHHEDGEIGDEPSDLFIDYIDQ